MHFIYNITQFHLSHFSLNSSRPNCHSGLFLNHFGVKNKGSNSDFHGDKSSASTLTSLAKVVGRFAHEPGSVRRGLELRFLSSNLKIGGSGLVSFGALGSGYLGFIRLQIDSTDRCEYSAISVGVFTHYFHVLFDLGTLIKTNRINEHDTNESNPGIILD